MVSYNKCRFALLLSICLLFCNPHQSKEILEKSPATLSVELVAPNQSHSMDDRYYHLSLYDKKTHLHVVVRNLSKDTINLWNTTFSYGFKAISFEIEYSNGQIAKVKTNPRILFDENNPIPPIVLSANEPAVFNVTLGDTSTWKGLPLPKYGQDTLVKIRCVYESISIPGINLFKVWAGKAYSKWYVYSIRNSLTESCNKHPDCRMDF